jgi:hypothetical protein
MNFIFKVLYYKGTVIKTNIMVSKLDAAKPLTPKTVIGHDPEPVPFTSDPP